MASREEEKRLRREEREAAEAAHAASQKRTRNLQFLLGALLTIAVVVVVVLAVSGGGGDDNSTSTNAQDPADTKGATIPKPAEANLDKAAKAADCVLLNPPIEGSSHVDEKVKYKTNPPSSGNHNPVPALDGIYPTGDEPTTEHLVHALEHGRINVQYAPSSTKQQISQLETVVSEELNAKQGYKTLLYRNDTDMPYAVAATAWGHILGCKTFNDGIFDAIRDFRVKYVDKGPEPGIPPTN